MCVSKKKIKIGNKGALEIKSLLLFTMLAIGLNIVFVEFALIGAIECPNLVDELYPSGNETLDNATDEGSVSSRATTYFNLMLNRCSGMPWYVFWIIQIPIVLVILYIILEYIPFVK
jgi:hypothetical protein